MPESVDLYGLRWFVTGGTGSFGSALVRHLLEQGALRIVVYSRDERKQEDMAQQLQPLNTADQLRFFLGDVRDARRVEEAMRGADVVVHAAALKIITSAEYNPSEVVQTNVTGTQNVVNAALHNGVWRMAFLSTDKATNPVTHYGSCKRVAESIVCRANVYAANRQQPRFFATRWGNVVASRGSVINLWRRQLAAGEPFTVTDPEATRFWITLEQAVQFLLSCIPLTQGGEVFVPRLPSCRVADMVDAISPSHERRIIGLRAGERKHELMLSSDEAPRARDLGDRYVILPVEPSWPTSWDDIGVPVDDGFEYNSRDNEWRLTVDEIIRLLSHTLDEPTGRMT